ncbi:MAG: alanyl-tRNA editing protein [Clostridia bacterium]|nr:alanyl-tRNA editing protein [Clostridia bacterium]
MFCTIRLFDEDAYLKSFSASVVSCEECDGGYSTVLDRTGFFPESGGQSCDVGTIGDAAVTHVYESGDIIVHLTDVKVEPGSEVPCAIDFRRRYRNMQNHSGEHVLCGIAHSLWGAENVGFHLSENYVRVDLDVFLDKDRLKKLEALANDAIFDNRKITAWYPDGKELETTDFRSKEGIEGRVRLVRIDGVDICACCAPHVASTAEIGVIKIIDAIKYKGGTRLEIICGRDAADMFISEHAAISSLAASYSVKREDLGEAVERQRKELASVTYELRRVEKELMLASLSNIRETDGNLCFFYGDADDESVREFLNGAALKCRIAAGFIGNDEDGYRFTIRSDKADLKALCGVITEGISGRGGGTPLMIRGSCTAKKDEIEVFFASIK